MCKFVVTILLVFLFAVPPFAPAGDEVDYSAPYLVVEDGKLVTKYPAREHEGDPSAADESASVDQPDGKNNYWTVVVAAIAVLVVFLLRRGRQYFRQSGLRLT